MNLSDNTLTILKNFAGINNSILVKEGTQLRTISVAKNILAEAEIEEYVSATYRGHYTGSRHEYRNVQTIDLMAAQELASGFCQANILKYGSRYGSKEGKEKKDLMKVIHYAMLLLHFDEDLNHSKVGLNHKWQIGEETVH